MSLSADRTDFDVHMDDRSLRATPEVKNTSVLYYGALVSCDTDVGAAKPFDGTETDKLLGWHVEETVTGDTSPSGGAPNPRASLITGPFRWPNMPVTGLAGTVADNGKRIWATNDGTYTIGDPGGSGAEVGYVDNYRSSSKADVILRNVGGYVDALSPLPTPTPTPTPT